ncbi:MAG: hypothetical protein MUP17_01390 [candidate division Zixibacteria bacterium]|nr:hypothetical protein [candidate division Zixibacteria bacterium]
MADNSENGILKEALSFIKQKWYSPLGLLALLIVELFILLPYLWNNFGVGLNLYEWIVVSIVIAVSVLLWEIIRRFPKNTRNKIGVLVAVTTESKREYLRLRSDLILRINEAVKTKAKENIFNIIEIPEHYATKIQDYPSALQSLKRAKAHFIIYGSCKQRLEKGNPHYYLSLDAVVIHKPIPPIVHDKFSQEFAELFPRRVLIPLENEISGFEITKDWIGLVARYIIGVAAFLSGEFPFSFELSKELHAQLKGVQTDILQIKKIKARVPLLISESCLAIANKHYFLYERTEDKKELLAIKPLLDFLRKIDPNNYKAHLLRGIYLFLVERDVDGAKEEMKRCKSVNDCAWRYSEAFLYAYERDLNKAESSYKKAFKYPIVPASLFQIEEFINDVLEIEPEKCQLWYCIGMINWFVKTDTIAGRDAFERFLNCGSATDFAEQKRKVKEYLEQHKTE